MAKIRTVLISVSDKAGIAEFAGRLAALGVEIISTGGAARLLRERGVKVTDVADYTGFPEILRGDLRTLHPKVHGGVLARREEEDDLRELAEHGIRTIDMVVVNLLPFTDLVADPSLEPVGALERIDIAGPTLVRAAAKNYTNVAVVTNPGLYDRVAGELEANDGMLSQETHFQLAREAFRHTARYDTAVAGYLSGIHGEYDAVPDRLVVDLIKKHELASSQNLHQRAAVYAESGSPEPSVAHGRLAQGPMPDLAATVDMDCGVQLAGEFEDPVAVVVERCTVLAVGCAPSLSAACARALDGGTSGWEACTFVANRRLDLQTAEALLQPFAGGRPFASLVASGFDAPALRFVQEHLPSPDETTLFEIGPLGPMHGEGPARDLRPLRGGLVAMERPAAGLKWQSVLYVTKAAPPEPLIPDLRLAWLCVKLQRSFASAVAAGGRLLALCAGHRDPMAAVTAALGRAGEGARGAVLACDTGVATASFVEQAVRAGVAALIQAGGTDSDAEVVEMADRHSLPMVFTGVSHFRL